MEANASTEAARKTAANKGTARRMGPWMLSSLPRKFGLGGIQRTNLPRYTMLVFMHDVEEPPHTP